MNNKKTDFKIMGIINVTPDSFYDKSRVSTIEEAIRKGMQCLEAGADILDIGGESTRPGAEMVSTEEELARVMPVIRYFSKQTSSALSIDTYKSTVAKQAIDGGVSMVNDISGFGVDKELIRVVANSSVKYVLTHIQGTPKTMQQKPYYNDVVCEVSSYFHKKSDEAFSIGVKSTQLILDPGIGFGKTVEHNLELLRSLKTFLSFNMPLMIGVSRKSFIGSIQQTAENREKISPPEERLSGSLAGAVWAYQQGVTYFRVHDVLETKRALTLIKEVTSQ